MKKVLILVAMIVATSATEAQTKMLQVNMDNGRTTEFEVNKIKSLTFGISPWTYLGKAIYGEDFVASTYTLYGNPDDMVCEYEVEIQENIEKPGLYRLVNPYSEENYPLFKYMDSYDDSQDYYLEIDATDPNAVWIGEQYTGMTWPRGRLYVYSLAGYYLDYGFSKEDVEEMGVFGSLKDGVITFPVDVLCNYWPDYSTSNLYYANDSGGFKVVLPGYEDTTKGAKKLKDDNGIEGTLAPNEHIKVIPLQK